MAWQKEKKKGNNRRVAFDDDEFYVVGQILADSIYPPSYIYIYIYREAFRGEARENVSEMRFDSRSNGLTKRGWGSWGYMNVLDSLVGGDRLDGSVNHRYLLIFVILLGVWGMIGGRVINFRFWKNIIRFYCKVWEIYTKFVIEECRSWNDLLSRISRTGFFEN